MGINTEASGKTPDFADSDSISEYAVSVMNWALRTGMIKGLSDTVLAPKNNATRVEVATIFYRFLCKL